VPTYTVTDGDFLEYSTTKDPTTGRYPNPIHSTIFIWSWHVKCICHSTQLPKCHESFQLQVIY